MNFHLQTFGEGEKRGLWLHGWMGSGSEGEMLQQALGEDTCLLCPDLPGHGETPLEGWTLDYTLTAIGALAEGCAWSGGYSMGGRLLMMAAERFPDAFTTLVIESASLGLADEKAREERMQLDQQRAEKLRSQGLQAFCNDWYRMEMWGGLEFLPEREGDAEKLAGALELFSVAHQSDLRSWIQSASQNILWLAGAQDRKYAEQAAWVQENTRHQVELVDAGHNVHLQCGEDWGNAVSEFLKGEVFLN